ncbi:hypothetical protein MIR68_003297 [Amoeboaphelidium protococcarum]|nr:hypothetical protein MIR68_003297 [Amoeboaphelidium protococcarum]
MLVLDCGSSPGGFSQVAAQCCDASLDIASELQRHLQPSSHIAVQTTYKNGAVDSDSNDSVAPSRSSQNQSKAGDTFESINASDLNNRNQGAVVAIDLLPMEHIPGVCALYPWDFIHSHTVSRLRQALGKRRFDVILSDMSPNLTGQLDVDHDRSVELCRYVIRAAQTLPLRPGGALFFKSIQGGQTMSLRKELEQMFNFVKIIKPEASRKESREVYILCQEYNSTKHIK